MAVNLSADSPQARTERAQNCLTRLSNARFVLFEKTDFCECFQVAGGPGFEPRLTESELGV